MSPKLNIAIGSKVIAAIVVLLLGSAAGYAITLAGLDTPSVNLPPGAPAQGKTPPQGPEIAARPCNPTVPGTPGDGGIYIWRPVDFPTPKVGIPSSRERVLEFVMYSVAPPATVCGIDVTTWGQIYLLRPTAKLFRDRVIAGSEIAVDRDGGADGMLSFVFRPVVIGGHTTRFIVTANTLAVPLPIVTDPHKNTASGTALNFGVMSSQAVHANQPNGTPWGFFAPYISVLYP